MERVRVLVELGGVLYAIGTIRPASRTLALRRLGDKYADKLGPFPSVRAARQTCQALSQAKVVRFPAGDGVARDRVRARRKRRRRRVLRTPVELASMSAARPSAPPRPSRESQPSPPSRPMAGRAPTADRRPSPEMVTELAQAMIRLETSTS